MKTERLYFGAAYYAEYLPYDRVEKDMEMIKRAGMNTIRIAESTWSTLEPHDGVYDFTFIDRMLDAAAKYHIFVIVGTPTYAIPAWLAKKFPDILAVTADGPGIYGHRQNMDITHPGYRLHAERVIRALMEHIRNVPHIIGFQLDNETKSYDTSGPRVQAHFVEYLKKKFPDLSLFNREFGLDYWSNRVNHWDEFPDVRGSINQSLTAEFRKFQRSLVTEFLHWQADIVREYARKDQFLTQNFDFDWASYSFGVQPEVCQHEAAVFLDVAGADIYHPSKSELTGAEITVCGNIARSLKKDNYLILETQAQGQTQWLPYPGQLRLQAYSHIANGSNSVMYWHWHSIHNAIESYWKGVLSHDFAENETYREAARIGAEWERIGSHLKNLRKKNHTAVLIDNCSLTGLSLFPLESTGERSYNTVLRWLGDALYDLNIEFDIVSSSQRDFSSYEFLIVPALYSAPEDLLYALDTYVAGGGHLIATFRTGFSDEYLKIYPDIQPHILHKCLGIHYDQFTYPKDVRVIPADNVCDTEAVRSELSSPAHGWMELISCETAQPVAFYAHSAYNRYAAAAENQYKNGSSLYLSALFGDALLKQLLLYFFEKYGSDDAKPSTLRFPVILKRGKNDYGRELYYYFNYSEKEQSIPHCYAAGTELLTTKEIQKGDQIVLAPWDLAVIESETPQS